MVSGSKATWLAAKFRVGLAQGLLGRRSTFVTPIPSFFRFLRRWALMLHPFLSGWWIQFLPWLVMTPNDPSSSAQLRHRAQSGSFTWPMVLLATASELVRGGQGSILPHPTGF